MRKLNSMAIFFSLLFAALFTLMAACDAQLDGKGESEALENEKLGREIWESKENQEIWSLQTQFIARVESALERGYSIDQLKQAARLPATATGETPLFAEMVFGDQKTVMGRIKGMNLVNHKILFEVEAE